MAAAGGGPQEGRDRPNRQFGAIPRPGERYYDFPTLDRLIAAEELGALDKETAQSLREAFAFIWQVRLDHHAQQISPGLPPDNSFVPTSCRHWHGKSCAKRFAPSPQPSSSSTDLFPSR